MRLSFLLAAVGLAFAASAAPEATDGTSTVVTLDEAVAFALAHQPAADIAEAQVASAEAGVMRSRTPMLPTVELSAGTTSFQASLPGGDRTEDQSNAGVRLNQTIYDFGRSSGGIAAAKASRSAAQRSREQTRLDVALAVTDAYFVLLANKDAVEANRQSVAARERDRDAARARMEAGTTSRFDLLRSETALASSRQKLVFAEGDVRRAKVRLNSAMGRAAQTPVDVTPPPPLPVLDIEGAVEVALRSRPDVQAARFAVESARQSHKAAKASNYPSLGASAGLNSVGNDAIPSLDMDWALNLGVSWPIIDAGSAKAGVKAADAGIAQAEAELRRVELAASEDVVQALVQLLNASEELAAAEATEKEALESRDLAVGRYQSGVGIELEVQDAESQYLTAQVGRIAAQYTLGRAQRAYYYAIGRLDAGR